MRFKLVLGKETLVWSALACASVAAWIGLLNNYLPCADDFPFAAAFKAGLWDAIWSTYAKTGIRRSFGLLTNMPLCAAPLEIIGLLCLGLHLTATFLVFDVCKLLCRMPRLAFAVAVLFGVFPFGYGAVVWACGSYIIPCVICFLAALAILLRHCAQPSSSDWVIASVTSVLIFVGCLAGEHLIFASALVGVLALVATKEKIQFGDVKKPWVIAPILAVGLFLALTLITQSEKGLTDIRGGDRSFASINPPTLLSVWFYQVRNLDCFQPWMHMESVRLAVQQLGWPHLAGAVLLLVVAWCCARRAQWNTSGAEKSPCSDSGEHLQGANNMSLLVVVVMMLGLSAVHALAGGYSAASRHQYAPLALLGLLVAVAGVRCPAIERLLAWRSSLPLVLLLTFGTATTWLVTGLNHFELKRHHALCDFLAKEKIEGPVHLQFVPPLYSHWPKMQRTLGGYSFDDAWVINLALESRGAAPISISTNSTGTTVRITWNGATNAVEIVSR